MVKRAARIGGLVLAGLVVGGALLVLANADDDIERYAVQWEAIDLSPDRRTVTVESSYPLAGFCVKEPDGIDISVDGTVATVAAWMVGPRPTDGVGCSLECGPVTQTVTLDEPLPESVERFKPVTHAVEGCE